MNHKILVLDDFLLKGYNGGSQRNIDFLSKYLQGQGYDVIEFNAAEPNLLNQIKGFNPELVILNNIGEFDPSILRYIIDSYPIIRLEQDYSWCKSRNGSCVDCINELDDRQKLIFEIYEKAKFIGFYCTIQREHTKRVVGDRVNNSYVFTAFMDPALFVDNQNPRLVNSAFLSGRYYPEQGFKSFIELALQNPELKCFTAGYGPLATMLSGVHNITDLGLYPYENMSGLYNLFERFIFIPSWPGYPRTLIEAELCGMQLIKGPLTGPTMWDSTEELRVLLSEAPKKFEDKMCKVMEW